MNKEFKCCSICGKKINWFRRMMGDKSCMGMIPTNQFCSNKCYRDTLELLIKQNKIEYVKERKGVEHGNV